VDLSIVWVLNFGSSLEVLEDLAELLAFPSLSKSVSSCLGGPFWDKTNNNSDIKKVTNKVLSLVISGV